MLITKFWFSWNVFCLHIFAGIKRQAIIKQKNVQINFSCRFEGCLIYKICELSCDFKCQVELNRIQLPAAKNIVEVITPLQSTYYNIRNSSWMMNMNSFSHPYYLWPLFQNMTQPTFAQKQRKCQKTYDKMQNKDDQNKY